MRTYLLRVDIRFQAGDDAEARERARSWIQNGLCLDAEGVEIKCQRLAADRPPTAINLGG